MTPGTLLSRAPVGIAAASFLAIVGAYLFAPADRFARALTADVAWTWCVLLAAAACLHAWRATAAPTARATWGWLGIGCLAWLAGQLVWSYYELVERRSPLPYPSLADIGFLGIYPCFAVGVTRVLRPRRPRRGDVETVLDTALITFTAGALAYEFLLEPLLAAPYPPLMVLTTLGWAIGGIAVLWLILVDMLHRTRLPRRTAAFVTLGVATVCVGNVLYALQQLRGISLTGTALDLTWDAGLLLLVAAAAAPGEATAADPEAPAAASSTPRMIALVIGLAGLLVIAARGALSRQPEADLLLFVVVGGAVFGARFLYALRADRRYAEMLEREVAAQTRTLMDSLAATAAAERHLRLVMEAVPDAIVLLDRDGRVLDLDDPAWQFVGPPAGQPLGRGVFDLLEPEAARTVRRHLDAAFAGDVQRFEVPFHRRDGSRGVSSVLCAPVRESGRVSKVLALARDVTDTRRTEAQLQQAEKLAALGQLVSGVAHEINNPAAIISGFAQTLLLDDLKGEQRDMVRMILDEASRIGRITSNLLAFARAGGKERGLVDLNDVVRRTFALRSYHLSTLNVAVSLELDPGEPKLWGNGSEVQQLLLNVLINAEQALMGAVGPRRITLRTSVTNGEIRLDCADTGLGIAPEIRSKIFDPFFTTKPDGVGTGLGLSICYGIVQDHGGRIWVESEPGRGATFSVVLPRDPRGQTRPPTAPHGQPGEKAPAAPVSVLLVDDEAGLRQAVARFLGRRGIEVRAVGDGAEALAALEGRTFDVIISDVRMPGMDGAELLAQLRAKHPRLAHRLIFSTGDTFAPDTAALLEDAGLPSLVKPFDFAKLEQMVRDVAAASVGA